MLPAGKSFKLIADFKFLRSFPAKKRIRLTALRLVFSLFRIWHLLQYLFLIPDFLSKAAAELRSAMAIRLALRRDYGPSH